VTPGTPHSAAVAAAAAAAADSAQRGTRAAHLFSVAMVTMRCWPRLNERQPSAVIALN